MRFIVEIFNTIFNMFSMYSFVLLMLFVFILFICFTNARNHLGITLFVFVIFLSTIAYFFDPIKAYEVNGNYTDLYRFWEDMKEFQNSGWNSENMQTSYENIIVVKILVYLVARTGNFNLLAALSSFLTYGSFAILLILVKKRFNVQNKVLIILFFIFIALINFKVTITNVRMPIGMGFFSLALFLDVFNHNRIGSIVLYVVSCFIHMVFPVFILLRVLSIIAFKTKSLIMIIILCLIAIFSTISIQNISYFLDNFKSTEYFAHLLNKIEFYTSEDMVNYIEVPALITYISKMVLLCITLVYSYKNIFSNNDKKIFKEFYIFTLLFLCFTIGSVWSYYLFNRLTNFMCYLIVLWIAMLNKRESKIEVSDNFMFGPELTLTYRITYFNITLTLILIFNLAYYFISYQYRVLCF